MLVLRRTPSVLSLNPTLLKTVVWLIDLGGLDLHSWCPQFDEDMGLGFDSRVLLRRFVFLLCTCWSTFAFSFTQARHVGLGFC